MRSSDGLQRLALMACGALLLAGCAGDAGQLAYRQRLEAGIEAPQDMVRYRTPDLERQHMVASAQDYLPQAASPLDVKLLQAAAQGQVADLKTLLADGAHEDARRELHAFKGLAATLGATALSKVAAQAESALLRHGQVFEAASLMAPVATMLQTVAPELESVAARLVSDALPKDNSNRTGEIDRKAFTEALQALLQALQAGDMEAMVLHANLHQLLANSSSREWDRELEPLDAAMADLELQRGALECELLLRQLTS